MSLSPCIAAIILMSSVDGFLIRADERLKIDYSSLML